VSSDQYVSIVSHDKGNRRHNGTVKKFLFLYKGMIGITLIVGIISPLSPDNISDFRL
jgi:hypothetical protein